MSKPIRFTKHALRKLEDLAELGFAVTVEQVTDTVQNPDTVDREASPPIAQKAISQRHVLRVVFVEEVDEIRVVTFYPGRRSRYESEDAL
jgi:hypothetical protein